jgi:hypothetical protein
MVSVTWGVTTPLGAAARRGGRPRWRSESKNSQCWP